MPSPKDLTTVQKLIGPELKARGFRRFGMTFNRVPEPGLVHVVGLQANQEGDRFTVNLGVYLQEIDRGLHDWWGRQKKAGEPGVDTAVPEEICWLRSRLGRMGTDPSDLWWSFSDVASAAEDVRLRIQRDAEPAFAQVSSRSAALSTWDRQGRPTVWRGEKQTPLGHAILLKGAGRDGDARAVIEQVKEESKGTPFMFRVEVLEEDLGLRD